MKWQETGKDRAPIKKWEDKCRIVLPSSLLSDQQLSSLQGQGVMTPAVPENQTNLSTSNQPK